MCVLRLYQILEAASGEQGLELFSDEIDLVILDIMMPGISGLRTCEEIRKRSNVPILFLTRNRIGSSDSWQAGMII